MKILYISAEVAPYVSVGGLSQVMYFLPSAISKLGHDVRIFTPKYGLMDKSNKSFIKKNIVRQTMGLKVPLFSNAADDKLVHDKKDYFICNVLEYKNTENNTLVYFLENREYYELRENVFSYKDDHIRFGLLSRGCLEWLLQVNRTNSDTWMPDVIHCNDWHTAYLMEIARTDSRYKDMISETPMVLTVHNFAYQGNYDFRYANKGSKDDPNKPLMSIVDPKFQTQNALARGLLYADAINTVSPTHASEILTPEYAEGLEDILYKVRGKLTGILNGLDNKKFNPKTDPIIKTHYDIITSGDGKKENKKELQKIFLLPGNDSIPIISFVGRLSSQKGLDMIFEVLPHLIAHTKDIQIIITGGGNDTYRKKLSDLQKKYPDNLGIHLRSDFLLPRKIFAGSDIMLIPSIFEPCGIVALEALRYGSVPIVRRTGGLNDIIEDFNPDNRTGNGLSFSAKDPWALYASIIEALTYYKQKSVWQSLVNNCMTCDFSWDKTALEYEQWYMNIISERENAISKIFQDSDLTE